MTEVSEHDTLEAIVARSGVVVCCGSGGVGKTTTAAVLAMHAARRGRKAVVVTIDPARRLADALGLEGLTNMPAPVEGDWPGQMWAMMLDTKATFDGLVERYARNASQAESILENTFYQNISSSLSGTQEYMASEKLYELAVEGDFDLVVVDTPPTRNALDFLEAPQRLARFLDHRLYRVLMAPTRGIVKAVNVAAQALMRSLAKVVGAEVIADAMAFFGAFEGMEEGFKDRARHVDALLRKPETSFILIASPRGDTVEEASYFASELQRLDIAVRALIVNRMTPTFSIDGPCEGLLAGLADRALVDRALVDGALADGAPADRAPADHSPLEEFIRCARESNDMADGEHRHLAGISARVAPAPVVGVTVQPFEVNDLGSLSALEAIMFDSPVVLEDSSGRTDSH